MIAAGFTWQNANWSYLTAGSAFWGSGRWDQVATALLWAMFAYSGWNAASYLAEEVEQPERTLPRSLLVGTATVMALYLLLNLFFFAAAPAEKLRGVEAVAAVAISELFGPGAGRWLAAAVCVALFSAMSAFMMIGPRVYFAMARDGVFFPFAARVHPRFDTPSFSIVAQGVCAAVIALTGTFGQLLTYIGFALGVFPWLTILGVILLRRRDARPRPYAVWAYPLLPVVYLGLMGWVMAVSLINNPKPSFIAIATVAAGIPAYYLTAKLRAAAPGRG